MINNYRSPSQQPSQTQIKRHQLHASIRRQQLDKYRQRKREQLFGFKYQAQQHQVPEQNKQQQQVLNQNAYKKRKLQMFMLQMWADRLIKQEYSLQIIQGVSQEMEKMDLANTEVDVNNQLQGIVKLLSSMLKTWTKQQVITIISSHNNSYHTINNNIKHTQTVTITSLLNNVVSLFKSFINEQNRQQSFNNAYKYQRQIFKKMMGQKRNQNNKKVNLQRVEYEIKRMDQQYEVFNKNHVLERCWQDIKVMVDLLTTFSVQLCVYEAHISSAMTGIDNEDNNNDHDSLTKSRTHLLSLSQSLFTILSLITHPVFTPYLFQSYLHKFSQQKYITQQIVDSIIETIYNFVMQEQLSASSNKNVNNNNEIDNKTKIAYTAEQTVKSTQILAMLMNRFTLSNTSIKMICKSLTHLFSIHNESYMPIFITTSTTNLLNNLLQPFEAQREMLNNLWIQYNNRQMSQQQFITRYKATKKIEAQQKIAILQLVGVAMNYISVKKYLGEMFIYLPMVLEILHFQMRELYKIKTIRQKPQFINMTELLDQKVSLTQQDDIIEYVLFVLRNIIGVTIEVTTGFIQKGGINDLLIVWQHLIWLQEMINKDSTGSFPKQRLQQVRRCKVIVTDSLYNITIMLTNSQQAEIQTLRVFIEFKYSSVFKLLMHHIKWYTFNQQLLYIRQLKESLKYTLSALTNLLRIVLLDGYRMKLIDDLKQSGDEFSGNMMRDMLTNVMMDEKVYGKEVSEKAQQCLQVADDVLKAEDVGDMEGAFRCEQQRQDYQLQWQQRSRREQEDYAQRQISYVHSNQSYSHNYSSNQNYGGFSNNQYTGGNIQWKNQQYQQQQYNQPFHQHHSNSNNNNQQFQI